jgi:hypothetical protein
MSNETYLDLVNDVLVRLRENEVQSLNQNSYSKLVGKFINDGKRLVENAYTWNVLRKTYTIITTPGVYSYVLLDSGVRFKLEDAINDTSNFSMLLANTEFINNLFLSSPESGVPRYFNFNGTQDGDTIVDLFPIPDAAYNIKINVIQPQDPLVNNSDTMLVAPEPVIFYAYARALAERGEDGGLGSSEAYQIYLQSLGDHIAIESSRTTPDMIWTA